MFKSLNERSLQSKNPSSHSCRPNNNTVFFFFIFLTHLFTIIFSLSLYNIDNKKIFVFFHEFAVYK